MQLIIIIAITMLNIILAWTGINVMSVNVGIILLALEIGYLYLSFGKVEIDEVAVLFLWGRPIKELKPGLYIALLGIFSVRKEKGTIFQDELPGEPENIFREDGKVPDGMFPPIRIKFGQPDSKDENLKDDPYNIAMVAEVVPVVAWRITSAITFFSKMGDVKNCRKILSDKAISVFGDDFSNVTPAKALLTLDATSQKLEKKLREETSGRGIDIDDAYVKPFIFSHGLNSSVVNVSVASQNAIATKKTADAEEYKRSHEGKGTADAEKLLLAVRRHNIKELAKISGTPEGEIVLWMNTLSDALKNSQYSIIPGSELFTSVSGIKEMLDKVKGGKS
jgi:regulator of protease activity HflC (stomatin/prohibitin superfamily)